MIWLLLACQTIDVIEGIPSEVEESTVPTEYVPPDSNPTTDQEWDLQGMSDAVSDTLSTIRTRHSASILEGYSMVMSHADSYCPQAYTVNGNSFWYGVCTSTGGMSYDGYLFYNTYEDYNLFGDGGIWDAELLSGATQMVDPEGRLIHWGGSAYLAEGVSVDGYPVFYSSINGSFLDDGSDTDWLEQGQSDTVTMYGVSLSSEGVVPSNGFMVSGSLQQTGAATALEFVEFITYSTSVGYPCWKEPLGALSVRDAYGRWVEVEFDVNANWQLEGECDGCGRAFYNGDEIGEICIDAAPLLNWRETPWE